MGLLALCCSKGDRDGDDQQASPSRPVQRPTEKATQNTPAPVKDGESSASVSQDKSTRRDLWKEAYESLDSDRKKYVSANGVSPIDAINNVIDQTTAKYEQWQNGGLRITRTDGDDFNLRDTAETILNAAMKAKDVISEVVSFDPTGHASSAWMVMQNTLDRRDAIFAASGYLAETLAYYSLIDAAYRDQGTGSDQYIDEALLRVYTAILDFTAEVKKGQDENAATRAFQGVFALTEQPLAQLKEAIKDQSAAAEKWKDLAANLGDRKVAAEHLEKTKIIESKVLTAEENSIVEWISEVSYSSRQIELQKRRTANTGDWILQLEEYLFWKSNPGTLMWLPGISGCGKSVLCSTIINDIEKNCHADDSKHIAYWFFQFGDSKSQSVDTMIRSMMRQLSQSPLLPGMRDLWKEHARRGSQPNSQDISKTFDNLISSIAGEIYFVFDALDECPQSTYSRERALVLSLLIDLLRRYESKVHILVTSRPEHDIQHELGKFSRIDLEARLAEDVKSFVSSSVARDPLRRRTQGTKHLISEKLLSSRETRFRWAELQIMELEKCRREGDIVETLNTVPQTLEETYRKVLEGLEPRDVPLAREIFLIVCLTPDVLEVPTIAAMMDLDSDSILEICTTSLLSIVDGDVRVAHFSVQEFLMVPEESDKHHRCQFSKINGHKFLAQKTIDLLLDQTNILTEESTDHLSLTYAAKYWNTHVAALGDIDRLLPSLQAQIDRLFTEPNVYFNWVRLREEDNMFWYDSMWSSRTYSECEPPIHLASRMGLIRIVRNLLDLGVDHNADKSGVYGSALIAASYAGHEDVVQLFLDQGVDVNVKGGAGGNALLAAVDQGHESLVRRLLDRGADPNDGVFRTEAELELVKTMILSLLKGAGPGSEFGHAITAASYHGNENLVQMILDCHGDVNARGGRQGTALRAAALKGHEAIVKLLLNRGADINEGADRSRSALDNASSRGHIMTVQILLDRGAQVNGKENGYSSALKSASSNGHDEIVQMLLARGAKQKA
ncbi:hypothetical protein N7452_001419 [Penicillium brevicompactum]|uniref:NACHT domain-containing protein n=1 Tax=Penicillium brevicompactum TaxID=5074 RepID=A0A9W9R2H9_PENBR|nr:hypothetical protein N7452_001419 [Penicillium brevicompactum]